MSFPTFLAFSAVGVPDPKKEIFGVSGKIAYRSDPRRIEDESVLGAAEQFKRAYLEVAVFDDWRVPDEWENYETVLSDTFLMSANRHLAQLMSESVTKVTKIETLLLSLLEKASSELEIAEQV